MTPEMILDGMPDFGRRAVDNSDVVRARISVVSRMSAMAKGAGWKIPMRRPWCAALEAAMVRGEKALATTGTFFARREAVAQKRQVYGNFRHEKGVEGCWAVFMPEDGRKKWGVTSQRACGCRLSIAGLVVSKGRKP